MRSAELSHAQPVPMPWVRVRQRTCALPATVQCTNIPCWFLLPPRCSKLTEVQNDVQEVLEAIGDVVNDDAEVGLMHALARKGTHAVGVGGAQMRHPGRMPLGEAAAAVQWHRHVHPRV